MLLVGGALRVALITTHLPLRSVAAELTREMTAEKLEILHAALQQRFGVPEPRIAVLALNPHGGIDAEEGEEERLILGPAIHEARSTGIEAEGPFSADAFFGRRSWQDYDAVLAPYHDQGLIPVKTEAAGAGVNVTLGLPIVRTSPDHGTAFAIAGEGGADPRATTAALRLGEALLRGEGAACNLNS
jgi:4-hydroxythreonine-4-phosphate dehydrogenase